MKKPGMFSLLTSVLLFAFAWLLTRVFVGHPLSWDSAASAAVAGVAGGGVTWFLALQRWRKQNFQAGHHSRTVSSN